MLVSIPEQAQIIVDLIRDARVERSEAIALVEQAMRTAYSGGRSDTADEMGKSMLRTFDKVVGGPQTEAVARLVKAGA